MSISEIQKKYFAAANTGNGFESFFDEIFFSPKIVRRYIIKGGPGTGKSSFMRRIGLAAVARGCEVEYYYCSSDTHSLDGLVIDGRVAVFDGTSPHCYDTVSPGVRDEIINLGEFWDAHMLSEHAEQTDRLGAAKKKAYANAYSYLRAAREVADVMRSLCASCVQTDKMRAAARRTYVRLGLTRDTGDIQTRQTRAFGVFGRERFDTLEAMAEKKYRVIPYYGIESAFLWEILSAVRSEGVRCLVSYDTVDTSVPVEIYFPEKAVWIGVSDVDDGDTEINMKRFANAEKIPEVRCEYRTAARIYDGLCALALEELRRAGEAHAEMEKLYVASMDFERQSEFCTRFIGKMK